MSTMRRLINDIRRKYLIVVASFLILFAFLFYIGMNYVSVVNDQLHLESIAVYNKLREQLMWFDKEMNIISDCESISHQLDTLSAEVSSISKISKEKIDFIVATRKVENKKETQQVYNHLMMALEEMSSIQSSLNIQIKTGEKIKLNLINLKEIREFKEINSKIEECSNVVNKINELQSRNFVFSIEAKSMIKKGKDLVFEIEANAKKSGGWKEITKEHFSYQDWDKEVQDNFSKFKAVQDKSNKLYAKLEQIPFDNVTSLNLYNKKVNTGIEVANKLISVARNLHDKIWQSTNDLLIKSRSNFEKMVNEVLYLKKQHGDYVDSSRVQMAQRYLSRFDIISEKFKKSLMDSKELLNKDIQQVERVKSLVESINEEIHDTNVLHENQFGLYFRAIEESDTLSQNCLILKKSIVSLTNNVDKIFVELNEISNQLSIEKQRIESALPNWQEEAKALAEKIEIVKDSCIEDRIKVQNFESRLIYYRNSGKTDIMSLFFEKLATLNNDLTKIIDQDFSGCSSCDSGLQLSELTESVNNLNNKANKLKQRIDNVINDFNVYYKKGYISEIKYVEYDNCEQSFAAQLQNGIRHFDFAIDIAQGGKHKVEIRFIKKNRSLYKISPNMKHNIALECTVSRSNNVTEKFFFQDLTRDWNGSVVFESDFFQGRNQIVLDLLFSAIGSKGETLRNGKWQFLYERGYFSTEMVDNFILEIWVDNIKQKILVGVPSK